MATRYAIFGILLVCLAASIDAATQVNCTKQINQQSLNYCHMWLSRFVDPQGTTLTKFQEQKRQESLQQRCCNQLGTWDEICRCSDIRDFTRLQLRAGNWDAPRKERIVKEAPMLLKTCNLGSKMCQI
ncbi:2S sulfur-rich seed storage protein 2-like protein [Tanacetum coccineum]